MIDPSTRSAEATSSVRISCAVMSHPDRAEAARRLADSLPELSPAVVTDPSPEGPPTTLRTSLAAWAAAPEGATHHLVLQDDAEPCPGMVEALTRMVTAHPERVLSLFCEWGSGTATMARWAALGGYGLAECADRYVPTVGILMPTPLARRLVASVSPEGREEEPDDEATARFLEGVGRPALVTVPNLIEHDGDLSLVGNAHRMGVRRSVLLREKGDPAPSPRVLRAPARVPFMSWRRARTSIVRRDIDRGVYDRHDGLVRAEAERSGTSRRSVVEALDLWLDTAEAGRRLEGALGYGTTYELWLTAAVTALWAPIPTADLRSPTPAARRALRTLAPGGLRTVVPEVLTDAGLRADLDALVGAAHDFGVAHR
ncbi:hypothetical protein ABZ645_25160 [Nocardiopsis alba]|uniref:hypothetical protein n=1 Tax=Nocardiopsis alba TaxID=53437 RepID=UPI0033FC89B3